jgi:hypothetical protein
MFRPIPPTTQTLIGLNVIAFALQMMRKMRQSGQQPAVPKPDAAVEAMKQQATGGN